MTDQAASGVRAEGQGILSESQIVSEGSSYLWPHVLVLLMNRYPRGNGIGVDLAAAGITKDLKGTPLEV